MSVFLSRSGFRLVLPEIPVRVDRPFGACGSLDCSFFDSLFIVCSTRGGKEWKTLILNVSVQPCQLLICPVLTELVLCSCLLVESGKVFVKTSSAAQPSLFMTLSAVDRAAGRTSPFPSSKSGALSPLPSVSLTEEHVAEAVQQSPDNGTTLDFTHKSLTDVGEDSVERLATSGHNEALCSITRHVSTSLDAFELLVNPASRIALGYNRLATLPTAFALLSSLRYLNLKNNNFSVFPDVVCTILLVMHQLLLTILQLTVMPSLEILDVSRNKIKRLPTQPGSLVNLRVRSHPRR